jgi:hypothetical protein
LVVAFITFFIKLFAIGEVLLFVGVAVFVSVVVFPSVTTVVDFSFIIFFVA